MNISKFIEQIKWAAFTRISVVDILQLIIIIIVTAYIFTALYKTRAWILVKGLLTIGAIYLVVYLTDMTVLQKVMDGLFSVFTVAIVIMLQPELQKLVENVGRGSIHEQIKRLIKRKDAPGWLTQASVREIVSACEDMGKDKTGALIVIERAIPLVDCVNSGIKINADISNQLLINIFEKDTPLHDGAVIIQNNSIKSATSYLPLSKNNEIDKKLGTRHRAAIGITEISDAVVVIVSEETGAISLCADGEIEHDIDADELRKRLLDLIKREPRITAASKKKHSVPVSIKIMAPVTGILLWFAILGTADPVTTKVFSNIPVSIVNESKVNMTGKTFAIESGDRITVRLKGRRSAINVLSNEDINATADMGEMSITNAIPIRINVDNQNKDGFEILDNNYVMKLMIEDTLQKDIPVEVEQTGDNPNIIHVTRLSEEFITVTGGESLVSPIDKAVAVIDVTGKSKDFSVSVNLIIKDKNGQEVSVEKLRLNQTKVTVDAEVYDNKEIPLNIKMSKQTDDKEWFELVDVRTESDTIEIAGTLEKLNRVNDIVIEVSPDKSAVDTASISVALENYLPEGVFLAKNQDSHMTVTLVLKKYKKIDVALSAEDIKVLNLPKDKTISFKNVPEKVTVTADLTIVDEADVNIKTLSPSIDINPKWTRIRVDFAEVEGIKAEDVYVRYKLN